MRPAAPSPRSPPGWQRSSSPRSASAAPSARSRPTSRRSGHTPTTRTHADADATPTRRTHHGDGAALPGLAVADAGWRLQLADDTVSAGAAVPFRFTVTGPDGSPETDYVRTHTKELHLIVVRRDLSSFQHVHPVRAADGSWSVPLDLPPAAATGSSPTSGPPASTAA